MSATAGSAPFQHALAAVDLLHEPSLAEAGLASWLRRLGCRRLTLAHVAEVDYPRVGAVAGLEAQRTALAELARELVGSLDELRTVVEVGLPAEVLPRLARERGADLCVLGDRRRGLAWELLTGGGGWEILRRLDVPALILPLEADGSVDRDPRGIAILSDFSEGAERALEVAATVARALDAPLRVVHALEGREYELPTRLALEERARRARDAGVREVATLALPGAATELEDAQEVELVVLGTRGLGKVQGLLLGSVARGVLASARCATLIVPE